jgi:tRNA(fMet)-specific endonuclease VapC
VRLALDTNAYAALGRQDAQVVELVETALHVVVPLPVIAELRAGFRSGSRSADNERHLLRFLAAPGVEVVSPDEGTTHHYAGLHAQLRRNGTPIPINDLWIAALVLQHDLVLLSRDRHFDHLPQLRRVDS